jgi:minor extracellular serine protease Vpr
MDRRITLAVAMSALMLASVMPGAVSARAPERFGRVDLDGMKPTLDRLPSRQDRDRSVQVIVELDGRPDTHDMGAALDAGRQLTEADKDALRRPMLDRQSTMRTRLRALGARIDASYTDVLNGFRIQVAAGKLVQIAALPGVKNLYVVPIHYRRNANTVAYTGADKTWGATGYTGEGVNIAIIDSGINYYHSDFNGPGAAAYASDNGLDRSDGNFPTAKVIEGWDLAGDDYDPDSDDPAEFTPNPDPDPLDCKDPDSPNVQHGTHVAGTAAGMGVRANGTAYVGPYDEDTLANTNFRVAPGTAPEASLMAYRVFGCTGGTFLVVDAVEMAVRDGADVINMSLGSNFGNPGSGDAVAVDNASLGGVTVVMSAGNDDPSSYITGSPGVATRGISVAAVDAVPTFPSVDIDMPTGDDIVGINANGNTNGLPVTGEINVFVDNPATPCDGDTGEGCEESGTHPDSYVFNAYVAGQIPVTFRGNGARVDRATQGDAQGAPAVVMVNNAEGFPPFEGAITGADIPFVGVPESAGARFETDEGGDATLSEGPELDNPGFKHTASFTSGGPRRFDNMIKPDLAAPGVGVFSADGATTNQGKSLSGTSMASPATAGIAALVIQAHPDWPVRKIKAAIIGTARPNKVDPYLIRMSGAGMVTPRRAVDVRAFALTTPGASSLAFGAEQIGKPGYSETLSFQIENTSGSAITYDLSNAFNTDPLGASVAISPTHVTVPGGARREVDVTLSFSRADAAALPDSASGHGPSYISADDLGTLFTDMPHVAGAIVADPTSGGPGVYRIRVPWFVAPRGLSRLNDQPKSPYTDGGASWDSSVVVRNYGAHTGIADVYAYGLQDANEGLDGIDIRAVGVQTLPSSICDSAADPADRCLVFAVNTWNKWGNASENEFDILIDVDDDGFDDYAVILVDAGLIFGALLGIPVSVVIDLDTLAVTTAYFATAPTNGATALLPVLASDLGLASSGDRRFDYYAASFDVYDDDGTLFQFDLATTGLTPPNGFELARYNAFDPAISNGDFEVLDPSQNVTIPLSVSKTGYTPTRGMHGWMVVTLDDESGGDAEGQFQADLIPVGPLPD